MITPKELFGGLQKEPNGFVTKDFMKRDVKAVTPDTPLVGAIDVMIANKFGCLPVVDDNRKLIGIISEYDLLKLLYEKSELPDEWYLDSRGISYKETGKK